MVLRLHSLVLVLPCAVCFADPPASSYVFPAGGQRGTTVECRVGGLNHSVECGFRVLGSGVEAPAKVSAMPTLVLVGPYHHNPVAQQAWDYAKDMAASIKIAADAPPGLRYWYCTTAEGATGLRPFVVGDLPEVLEDEDRTLPGRPQAVTLPVTINGRIFPRADLDEFAFEAKAGEHLSCAVMSQQLGHKLDAKLELRDAAGQLIAEADDGLGRDPLLLTTIPGDGRYVLRIHDIAFEGDQDYVYRLTLRTGAYVTHVFPAGGRRGTTPTVQLYGKGLGGEPFAARQINLNSDLLARAGPSAAGGGLRAVPGSAMTALMTTSTPATANSAALNGAATVSVAPAAATTNQNLLPGLLVSCPFQLSDLPEFVESESGDASEPPQRVTLPGVVNGQIGTPRDTDTFVFATKKDEKFDFEFFGRRLGSPITGVWSIEDSQGKQLARQEGDSRVSLTVPADGDYTLRVHELHRETHGGPEFIYRIVATPTQPDFRLTLQSDAVGVQPGQTTKTKLIVARLGGFAGEIQLAASELPAGVTLSPVTVAGNQNQLDLSFTAAKDALIGDTHRAVVIGSAVIDGQRVLHAADVPVAPGGTGSPALVASPAVDSVAVTVTHSPRFSIDTEEIYVNANRGATFVQRFTIDRQPGFDGEITLAIADRQARYLQGATGPAIVVKPGQREVDYPVFFPEVMDLNRTARVLLMGTAKLSDAAGKVHYVTSTTKKQIVVRVSPSILTLSTDAVLLEAKPGHSIDVPLRVGRAPELTGPIKVEAVLPAGMTGISASAVTLHDEHEAAVLRLQIAADAQLGHHDRIQFRASAQRGGLPVVAETLVEIEMISR